MCKNRSKTSNKRKTEFFFTTCGHDEKLPYYISWAPQFLDLRIFKEEVLSVNKLRTKLNVTTSFFVGADFYVDENFSWKWNDGDLIESDSWWNEKGVKPEQPILPI